MNALELIVLLVIGEIISAMITRLLFIKRQPKKPVVVREKMTPVVLIIRYPRYNDERDQIIQQELARNFSHSPFQVILQLDETVETITYEYPKNFYCDSMKPINYN